MKLIGKPTSEFVVIRSVFDRNAIYLRETRESDTNGNYEITFTPISADQALKLSLDLAAAVQSNLPNETTN